MASSPLNSLRKPLADAFNTSHGLRDLPPSLVQAIEELVGKHPTVDDASSQTLHEDLLKIHKARVVEDETKFAGFLQALLLFRPWLVAKKYWWNSAIFPVLNNVGRLRVESDRASDFMVGVLAHDTNEKDHGAKAKESRLFLDLTLDSYFDRTKWSSMEGGAFTWENEHCAAQFEHILISFAKKKPKSMMLALDPHILEPRHRMQALGLLAIVIQHQPAHIHSVLDTQILEHLLKCLTIDASTITVQFAMTALVMFLPHIPSAIRKQLPQLFFIYSRLVCWDQVDRLPPNEGTENGGAATEEARSPRDEHSPRTPDTADGDWTKVYCSAEGEDVHPLDVNHFFTFIYGLYPLNFTSFVRNPQEYLKDAGFPGAEKLELNQDLIRERTAPLRDMHRLHPNFYNFTVDQELKTDRWLSSESSEIVGECIGLFIEPPKNLEDPGPPPTAKLPPIPTVKEERKNSIPSKSLLQGDDTASNASTRDSQRNTDGLRKDSLSNEGGKASTEAKARGRSPGQSNSARRALSKGAPHESPMMLATDAVDDIANTTSLARSLTRLHLLKVKSELSYERFLRQQQSAHLGHLQRRHISDATMTANYENILNLNKTLTSRLTKTTEAHNALKQDVASKRQQQKAFELDLSTKLRSYRSMEREWSSVKEEMVADRNRLQKDNEALKKLVVTSESRELQSGQAVDAMSFDLKRADKAMARVQELENEIRVLKHEDWEKEKTALHHKTLTHELEAMRLQLEASRGDYRSKIERYEKTVTELTLRVRENEFWEDKPQVKSLIERFNQQKETLLQLRTDYKALRHENIELEIRLQEYEETQNIVSGADRIAQAKSRPMNASPSPQRSSGSDEFVPTPRHAPAGYSMRRPSCPSHVGSASARSSAAAAGGIEGINFGGSSSAPARRGPPFQSNTLSVNRASGKVLSETGSASGFDSDASGVGSFYKNKSSAFSADSINSAQTGGSGKTKVSTKSEKRVYGRGGSQNIGKTDGEEAEEKKKFKKKALPKVGGIRGLKGLM